MTEAAQELRDDLQKRRSRHQALEHTAAIDHDTELMAYARDMVDALEKCIAAITVE